MATSIFKEYFKGYEVLGELGRGNARVLKARSLQSGELVAIKHFAFNTEPDTLRRFQRESEIMKSIRHHHIVKIIEVHLDAELPYIVMQLVEGGDLRSLLKTCGALDVATVIRLAHQITEALEAIHSNAVVHRDIKPENIMYRRLANGEIHFLLTDFGIAKLREQTDAVTVTGASMLTYDYASPEQFNQSKNVAAPTDYYSLGVVLYECLTGRVPFELEQDDLLMHIHRVISSPLPVPQIPGKRPLPPSLLQLLDGLMAKQSIYRLADPGNVQHLLHMASFEEQQGIQTPAYEESMAKKKKTIKNNSPSSIPVAQEKTPEKRQAPFITMVLLMIIMAVFFSWTSLVKSNTSAPKPLVPNSISPLVMETKENEPAADRSKLISHTSYTPESNTVQQPIPEPDPGIALINGLYYNDFSNPQDSVWKPGKMENSVYKLVDGKYVMEGLTDSLSYSTSVKINLDIQKDFTVAANTTYWSDSISCDPFGIYFCGDEEQDSYYIFYITSNGFYCIGATVNGEWRALVDWTSSVNIRQDAEMNFLSIEKQADSLRFYINDKLETVMPFTGGFGNYFGLRVDGAQTVLFDHFIVKGTQ